MEYSKQALQWLLDHASNIDEVDVNFLLKSFKNKTRAATNTKRTRSDAMLSVMVSGLSLAESCNSFRASVSLRSGSRGRMPDQ